MDEDVALLFLEPARLCVGVVVVVPAEHDGGAELARRLHLAERGGLRHHDGRVHAEPLGVEGDRLRVVACACGDDSALALFGGQQRELVRGTALLERAGAVQVLELEVDLRRAELAERLGERAWSDGDDAADAVARGEYVLQGDHRGAG